MSVKFHDVTISGMMGMDSIPTQNSTNAVSSGGVWTAMQESKKVYQAGTTAPSNTNLLWIDTVNGLKYWNGSAWVTVPVAYNQ